MKEISNKTISAIAMVVIVATVAVAFVVLPKAYSKSPPLQESESSAASSEAVSSRTVISVPDIVPLPPIGGTDAPTGSGSDAATQSGPAALTSGQNDETNLTEFSKPASEPPKPELSGEPDKVESALKDPTKPPQYNSQPAAPETPSKAPETPKDDAKDHPGEKYVPGFGWMKPGHGEGEIIEGDWGGGSQIGIM